MEKVIDTMNEDVNLHKEIVGLVYSVAKLKAQG